jgi:hypothetical protein
MSNFEKFSTHCINTFLKQNFFFLIDTRVCGDKFDILWKETNQKKGLNVVYVLYDVE